MTRHLMVHLARLAECMRAVRSRSRGCDTLESHIATCPASNYLGFLVDSSRPVWNLARKKVDQLLLVSEDFCLPMGS